MTEQIFPDRGEATEGSGNLFCVETVEKVQKMLDKIIANI
jgi:hypothetical protein